MSDSGPPALRAEHDALAKRLAVRPSVDALRRAAVVAFLGLVALGISWALLWDRYGTAPTELARRHTGLYLTGFVVTLAVAVALFVAGGVILARSRGMAREEAQLFERLGELRRALGIDP
jgi:hypothetical protein